MSITAIDYSLQILLLKKHFPFLTSLIQLKNDFTMVDNEKVAIPSQ